MHYIQNNAVDVRCVLSSPSIKHKEGAIIIYLLFCIILPGLLCLVPLLSIV